MNADSTGPDDLATPHGDPHAQNAAAGARFSLKRIVIIAMPLALLVAGVLGGKFWAESSAERQSSLDSLDRKIGIASPIQNRLADRFDDADGDLVADCPKNAKDLIDPGVLTFSYIPSDHADEQGKIWKRFCEELQKSTGKQVKYLPFAKTEDQVKALKEGRLHVAG